MIFDSIVVSNALTLVLEKFTMPVYSDSRITDLPEASDCSPRSRSGTYVPIPLAQKKKKDVSIFFFHFLPANTLNWEEDLGRKRGSRRPKFSASLVVWFYCVRNSWDIEGWGNDRRWLCINAWWTRCKIARPNKSKPNNKRVPMGNNLKTEISQKKTLEKKKMSKYERTMAECKKGGKWQ